MQMLERLAAKKREGTVRSLRIRIVSILALVFLVMVVLLAVVIGLSMRTMLEERESDNAINQAKLSESVLLSSVSSLPSVTRDWSSWNDTYDFVEGRNDGFLDDYLTEYPLQLFRINILSVLRPDGEMVYGRFYDPEAGAYVEDPPDLSGLYAQLAPEVVASFTEGMELDLSDTTQIGKEGFVSYGGQIYYLSCYPILHSDETGPVAGVFIFGRVVDDAEIRLMTEDGAAGTFAVLTPESFGGDSEQVQKLRENGELLVTGAGMVTAYVVLPDILGAPSLAVAVSGPRALYQQGTAFINLIVILVAVGCMAVLVVAVLLLDRMVARPLAQLVRGVNGIDLETVGTTLPEQHGTRELDELARAVNGMLVRIGDARDTIQTNNDTLYRLANYDQLTGLPNRLSGQAALQDIIDKASEASDEVTVYYIDIGRFKYVNDTLGRDAGDDAIRQVAERLSRGAGEGALTVRYEGDKFFVAKTGLYGLVQRQKFADEMFGLFDKPVVVRQRDVDIGLTIGSAAWPDDAPDAQTLVNNAEMAMYNAKTLNSGCYQAYHQALHAEIQRNLEVETWMREGIANDFEGFEPYFQPVVNVKSGEIETCEALMRWKSPEGMVGPVEFIPLAEESGLIIPLTWWLLEECCVQARRFAAAGTECRVAVNVTAQVLLHPDFVGRLTGAAKKAGVRVSVLEIEIIEEALVDDFERANRVLGTLHMLGIKVSVDDFGTGYSSLSYLNRLRVDRIKIDKGFVSGLGRSQEDQAIVLAVLAVAGSLGMTVTAEGVENADQLAFLKQAGCDEVQGFLFSRALPADGFIEFVQQWQQELERSKKTIGAPRRKATGMPGIRDNRQPQPPRAEGPAAELPDDGVEAEGTGPDGDASEAVLEGVAEAAMPGKGGRPSADEGAAGADVPGDAPGAGMDIPAQE
uniref:Putative diguanylate cyclase n=1 Tax=termite gut metagenome TaxID=433724 RepID=S0DFF6_9ZZZZ